MFICEQCGKDHDGSFGSGRFCCRSCSNRWVAIHQSKESKIRKIEKGKDNLTHTWVGRKGFACGVPTDSEKFVEEFLIAVGVDFQREKSISIKYLGIDKKGRYVLDFYFPLLSLDLEVDGTTHLKLDRMARDSERDKALISAGFLVERITFNGDYDNLHSSLIKLLNKYHLV